MIHFDPSIALGSMIHSAPAMILSTLVVLLAAAWFIYRRAMISLNRIEKKQDAITKEVRKR